MLTDTHTHLVGFSSDGRQTADQLLIQAARENLAGICVTDHYEKDVFYTPGVEEIFSLSDYFTQLEPLRRKTAARPPHLYLGIELGYMPQLAADYLKLVRQWPFDQVILSLHILDGEDPYADQSIYRDGQTSLYQRYLERLGDMIIVIPDHDIVGHFDYICRYAPYSDRKMRYAMMPQAFDNFFRIMIKNEKCLEINSGTIAKLLAVGYEGFDAWPDPQILLAYQKLGGFRISLGSDAHYPEHIARFLCEGSQWLKQLGFTHLTHYVNRQPVSTKI